MEEFSNINKLDETINYHLEKTNYKIYSENPNPEIFQIYYRIYFEDIEMNVLIGLTKDNPFKIEVVSNVRFSPNHIDTIKENPNSVRNKMAQDIFMWLTPREGQFHLELNEKNQFENSYYVIITPIYEGDYSFSNLMKAIDNTVSKSLLTRRIIQSHLNKYEVVSE